VRADLRDFIEDRVQPHPTASVLSKQRFVSPRRRAAADCASSLGRRRLRSGEMNSETGCHRKAPVKLLLLRTKVPGRIRYRDDLWPIDSIRSPMVDDRRLPVGDNVLHPISAFAIWEGNQKPVVVFDRDNGGLIGPARMASDVTDDRVAGFLSPSGSHGQRPRHLRQSAQGCLSRSVHSSRLPAGWSFG